MLIHVLIINYQAIGQFNHCVFNSLITMHFNSLIAPLLDSLVAPLLDSLITPLLDSLITPLLDSLITPLLDSLIISLLDSLIAPLLDIMILKINTSLRMINVDYLFCRTTHTIQFKDILAKYSTKCRDLILTMWLMRKNLRNN